MVEVHCLHQFKNRGIRLDIKRGTPREDVSRNPTDCSPGLVVGITSQILIGFLILNSIDVIVNTIQEVISFSLNTYT